jgi:hypothetical protein
MIVIPTCAYMLPVYLIQFRPLFDQLQYILHVEKGITGIKFLVDGTNEFVVLTVIENPAMSHGIIETTLP